MKNKRVILVLIALAVVAGGSLLYILSWYRSGKLPAGPSDFFDAGEMERSTKRLESFRLPVEKTIALCAAVTNHTAAAESVRFTNPTSALAQLADLQRDLATLEAGYSSHVEEKTARGNGRPRTKIFSKRRIRRTQTEWTWRGCSRERIGRSIHTACLGRTS